MNNSQSLNIAYFSDVLCIWAYTAQIRLDELQKKFGKNISISYHFIPVFGCTEQRIGHGWKEKDKFAGYSKHVLDVSNEFPHIEIHPDIWQTNIPTSSASCHHFIKSIQLLENKGIISDASQQKFDGKSLFEETIWRIRLAFFRDLKDISNLKVLMTIAKELDLPADTILDHLNNGQAMAAMCRDAQLQDDYKVEGSPTYILNEGRQKLYGNVGYKIIEANVQEVLERPENHASWC